MNTHSEDTAGVAAVNERIIQELREEDGDLLADLVGMFVEEVPGQLTELEAALRKGDAGATRLIAHTLKGTAGNFGASQMQTLASAIEMKARDGALAGAPAIFVQLRTECARVREALEAVR